MQRPNDKHEEKNGLEPAKKKKLFLTDHLIYTRTLNTKNGTNSQVKLFLFQNIFPFNIYHTRTMAWMDGWMVGYLVG